MSHANGKLDTFKPPRHGSHGIHFPRTTGELSRCAKLNKAEALHIRKCAWNGVPLKELAALFGVGIQAITNIKTCRTWSEQ